MKKALSFVLTLALAFAFAVPAFAETRSTLITSFVVSSYTIQIPATTAVIFNTLSTSLSIGLAAAHLEPNHQVTFTATSSGTLKNGADNRKTIAYTVSKNGSAFSSVSFTKAETQTLTIDITQAAWDAAAAGSYSDTLTFTVTDRVMGG